MNSHAAFMLRLALWISIPTNPSKLPESLFSGWEKFAPFFKQEKGWKIAKLRKTRRRWLKVSVFWEEFNNKFNLTNLTIIVIPVMSNTDGWRAVASRWTGNAIVVQCIRQCHIRGGCRGILPPQHPHHISPQVARSLYRRRRGRREVVVELIYFIRHNFSFYRTMFYRKVEKEKLSNLIGNFFN